MSTVEDTVQKVHEMENVVGTSKPPPNEEAHDSNDDETEIKMSLAPMLGLDGDNLDDIQKPPPSYDFIMVNDDEESIGSQHSTSKPKQKIKKKITISQREFLNLQAKVDQILVAFSSMTPKRNEPSTQ